MEAKHRRILIGCLAGCLIPVVLLIGSCVGFQAWLRTPGELLEPQRLLDEQAVGYVEWRMELENPGTQRFFDAAVDLMGVQSQQMPSTPLLDLFNRWNQRRQERELRRLFPATGAWMVYPHGFTSKGALEDSDPARLGHLYSFSSARMANQLRLMDWIGGVVFRRALGDATRVYRGERLYVLGDREDRVEAGSGDPVSTDRQREVELAEAASAAEQIEGVEGEVVTIEGPPLELHVFVRGEGVFVANESAVSLRAIDHLEERRAPVDRQPTQLERLFASVPEEFQVRGAVLNRDGELSELLAVLLAGLEMEPQRSEELSQALERSRSAALGAGILPDGGAEIEIVLDGPNELVGQLEAFGEEARERLAERDFDLRSDAYAEARGVVWKLRFEDVVGSVERSVTRAMESARSEFERARSSGRSDRAGSESTRVEVGEESSHEESVETETVSGEESESSGPPPN
ncbi:MAG: hypothetical protein DWQ36_24620 [Acidobacteria bacterium]|nr:MAG: hypothetical protein DWQ30_16930 [Acidobacteriota bacterium]REJ99643.1 MAG: hypothetical protein DWQ36_24620 [Acidobacteriota bacterium]